MKKITLFWFRRDLRLFDNAGLHHALQSGNPVLPLFIFDSDILDGLNDRKDARVSFLHQTVDQMNQALARIGSGLLVKYGKPAEIITSLCGQFEVDALYTNRDYEPYARSRDSQVQALLQAKKIGFYDFKDHVIFEKQEIVSGSAEPYKVFTPYKKKWLENLSTQPPQTYPIDLREANFYPFTSDLPTLASMGFSESSVPVPQSSFSESLISKYDQQRDFPAIAGTSRLGIHLRFGTLSIRQSVAKARQWNQTWLSELIWREFYIMILANFPHVAHSAFKPQYNAIPWRNNVEEFEKWCQGKTGYPIVDAGMRELNATGFMHNRVRMITASFLSKHLLIDWQWGEAYFAEKLLDYELASNNGGWQWAAGTGTDAQPYFRIFNPYSQTEKFDKQQHYIKKWVPELNTSAYPAPMVDHKAARQRALATYKAALAR